MTQTKINTVTTSTIEESDDSINNYVFSFLPCEIGIVTSVSTGIVKVSGLPNVGFEELLQFPNGLFGIAYNIDEDEIGVILLGKDSLQTYLLCLRYVLKTGIKIIINYQAVLGNQLLNHIFLW